MNFRGKFAFFALAVVAYFAIPGDGSFSLGKAEERALLKCLRRSWISRRRCFGQNSRMKLSKNCRKIAEGSLFGNGSNLDLSPAEEYLCSLAEYHNSMGTENDVLRAVLDLGSCSNGYPRIAAAWKRFLGRRGDEIQIEPASWQSTNGSKIRVRFTRDNITSRPAAESLTGVDIVITRTLDDEVYGRYLLRATIPGGNNKEKVVHETAQSTCPSEHKRFFVAELNDLGREAVQNWLEEPGNIVEFSIDVRARRRVTEEYLTHNGHHGNQGLGLKVSAIVLHFAESSFSGIPVSGGIIFPFRARRRRRSAIPTNTDCHRGTYVANYRNSAKVIRPDEFDIGECVGSCDHARTSTRNLHLNATNHALGLLWDLLKTPMPGNVEPTVCCVPITYRRFHYIVRDIRGIPMGAFSDSMIAEYCGCR